MKNKVNTIVKFISALVLLMGIIHEIATFTPMMAGKFAAINESAMRANTYFSLMCGAFLITGGAITIMLSDKVGEYKFLRAPYMLMLAMLAIDGILAVVFMPHNPFAWMTFVLTLLLGIFQPCCNFFNGLRHLTDTNK